MTTYSVFQIVLTDKRYNEWNAGKDEVGYKMYLDTTCAPKAVDIQKALAAGMYTKVAEIEAGSFEVVFQVGNIGPEERIKRLDQMHSVSVGDIVVGPDGKQMFVATFGFKPVYGEVA